MPQTLFYRVVISFADAPPSAAPAAEHSDRVYRISESAQHQWTIAEDDQPVALSATQQRDLTQLLATLEPAPDPAVAPTAFGADGTWITVVVQRAAAQHAYRWWGSPPPEWSALGAVVWYVQQLADAARALVAEQQRMRIGQLFSALAARDLPGVLALYHPDVAYSNPLVQLRGPEVPALWRMLWLDLPDLRVTCAPGGLRPGGAVWDATYTYPPTGRAVAQHGTSHFTFADGVIIQHADRFDVHMWAGSAYGVVGRGMGGWRLFQRRIARRSRARLAAFMADP